MHCRLKRNKTEGKFPGDFKEHIYKPVEKVHLLA